MEPYTGSLNFLHNYSAMQGIVHFIGWTIAIIILIYVFKFVKKHQQEDERAKKYTPKNPVEELKNQESKEGGE
ncbi:hypothetical protein SULAZ_1470 [Sulfurihydrogenibium azorense Az-Fu1]|jgi:H+/gluconate symporter-like permease|uniref:Uncharacterized protein n=1 Tax=Sulfurihydrogenibium azorense (strain DSM 15241 / OCM 825 / Az-Fu1) TaxID=204536 RepID=C1DWF0_SULAA|nr:hypothetical protein [Sulfurihydrogenibium azorense]ACN98168.1 hypothetical protein SULAZ_1470 [Sulfurihydrogenibium azorense Az-Fu1]MDM7273341.1 hypothetical protein [Sulfurihydrogenibium azorense]